MAAATVDNLAVLGSGDVRSQDVAGVAPCSPLQEGVLLSPSSYAVYWIWNCLLPAETCVDSFKLENAWRAAALKHPIYATIFASDNINGGFSQIILRSPVIDIQQITTKTRYMTAAHFLAMQPRPKWTKTSPRHTLTICTNVVTGQVACRFDICHTLYDVYSLRILLDDVVSIYHGQDVKTPAPFTDVVRYIAGRTKAETSGFWSRYLRGAASCLFPTLPLDETVNATQDEHDAICVPSKSFDSATLFCSKNGITRSVFMHIAWALVLAHFNGREDICFGYMGSGRDAPVTGIDRICGPMANLLISRVNLTTSLQSLLQVMAKNLKEHRKHQQTYFAPVFHELGLGGNPLFNTMVNLLRAEEKLEGQSDRLIFEKEILISPHEFDIVMEGYLHPETIAITLYYRRGRISHGVAEEVCKVLCWVSDFLIESGAQLDLTKGSVHGTANSVSLSESFSKYMTGHDRSFVTGFWKSYLNGVESLTRKTEQYERPDDPKRGEFTLDMPLDLGYEFSLESLARVAWAILLTQENDSDEVFFGTTIKNGQSALQRVTESEASCATLLPCKLKVHPQATVRDLLEEFSQLENFLGSNEAPGLHWLRQIHPAADRFTTAIAFQGDFPHDRRSMDMFVRLESRDDKHVLHLISYRNVSVHRTARRFIHILRQLCRKDNLDAVWRALAGICEDDVEEIHSWNSPTLPMKNQTVHGLFRVQVQKRPESIAVHAWNGTLTYGQLDRYSTLLAFYLLDQGIQPGSIVVLCFEKSILMPISMLAVAKAGIAGLGIDPNQPESRLAHIVSESKATAILCSRSYRELGGRLGAERVLPVALDTISGMQLDGTRSLPTVRPTDILYTVFTSGSTGKPKGVLVSHGSYSAAAICQHEPYGFNQETRVLDFSSYAFDAAWYNLMHTVTSGGCLCVPSTADLHNDLGGCILRFGVTLSFLTPTVCRGIGRNALIPLKRLLLGGEMIVPTDIAPIGDNCIITLTYGPSECTPMTMIHNPKNPADIALGHGIGVKTWIVSPNDVHQLCPIGVTGELCLEGPLLGDGYLGDKAKTEQAFFKNLAWHRDPQAQIYRTGDLAKYTGDEVGTLVYIGRKDTQVKLRGQRVELGEVEEHLHRAILARMQGQQESSVLQIVAEVIHSKQTTNAVLVAFVSLRTNDDRSEADYQKFVGQLTKGLSDVLEQQVPSYMVPASYIPLPSIPTTITGKTDRIHLRNLGDRVWWKFANQDDWIENESCASRHPTERMLQQIWSEVLNVPLETVSTTKQFASLGGDSITAMQVVSQCRKQGVALTVADILSARTIQRLAPRCCRLSSSQKYSRPDDDSASAAANEEDGEPFQLSPIQKKFFRMCPDGEDHFNQCFMLELNASVSKHGLQEALRAILNRHPMLRARYCRPQQGAWSQYISSSESWEMAEYAVSGLSEAFSIGNQIQKWLSIVKGPVFSAIHFTVANHQPLLLLSAHHLVIDLVSWRIIWKDLEDFIKNRQLLSTQGTSFRHWCKEQDQESRDLVPNSVLPFVIPTSDISFWGCSSEYQVRGNAIDSTMILDRESSELLMGRSNDAMRTEPLDVILGALAYSFRQSFPEHPVPTIFLEGHGRESLGNHKIDVSDTVGWFTTIHPLPLAANASDTMADLVCLAKDLRRRVPGKGQQYFASRFYSESCIEAFKEHDTIEVLINFAGSYQQLESNTGLFKLVSPPSDEEVIKVVAPSSPRLALIELSMAVKNGQLELTTTLNKHMLYQDRLNLWQMRFLETIRDAAKSLSCSPVRLTRADIPLLSLSDVALRHFNDKQLPAMGLSPKEVIDAYPVSPLQEGILLSTNQGLSTYDTFWIWKCMPRDGEEKIDTARLAEAWRSVVRKHTIFSTVFTVAPSGEGFIQLVLSEPEIKVTCLEVFDRNPEDVLYELQRPLWASQSVPRHHFTICQSRMKAACRLDINHALIDGGSLTPLVEDLRAAYNGFHSAVAPPFRDLINHLARSNQEEHTHWWAEYLRGVKPCEVRSLFNEPMKRISDDNEDFRYIEIPKNATAGVLGFCKRFGVTRSVFLQIVWGMVLSYITDSSGVCFGYLTSGRDAPIQGVDRMIGPLANMLVSKIELDQPASEILKQTSDDSIQHLLHQHVSLARIQHKVGLKAGQRLFNTAMTLRESDQFGENDAHGKISFEYQTHQDPHEFDLLLSARINTNDLEVSVQLPQRLLNTEAVEKLKLALTSAINVLLSSKPVSPPSTHGQQNEETLFTAFKRTMVESASQRDLDLIWSWNSPLPQPIQRCVHDDIRAVALQNWNQPAVCAWDGEISYGQLETMSMRVSNSLRAQGIGQGNIVPICFEKSMWMPIAALGVMRTGAAVVALDVTLPERRLQDIIKQVHCDVILASMAQRDLAGRLSATKILVLPSNDEESEDSAQGNGAVLSSPEDLLYIVFTSGSTGTPKGTMLTHAHISSMLHYQREALGLNSASRVYNFASYAFDVAWNDFFHALTCGGCLCIPSEEDRKNDIEVSMTALRANYAHITPTILRHIDWRKATGITVVNLSGEPVLPSDRSILSCETKVVNVYGPAETNVVTAHDLDKLTTQEVSIGKGIGASTWIVDLQNTDVLVPVGEIGELWIEGPLSGLGYLGEVSGPRKAWVANPIWLTQGTERSPGRSGQLYRTGDLVRYTKDGYMIYCGRADRQVKVNGQRIELGEIEVALQALIKNLGHDWRVAVETAQPLDSDLPVIMAFIAPRNAFPYKHEFRSHIIQEASLLREQLRSVLPEVMIPRAFVPLTALPLTPTGKTNSRELQAYGSSKSIREWTFNEKSSTKIRQAVTECEKAIALLCEDVLQISETMPVSMSDNFFRIGGDSVFAMRFVSKAREIGYSLTVKDIFKNPVISDLAKVAQSQKSANVFDATPPVKNRLIDDCKLRADAASICNIREEQVLDLLPCTPLQRNLVSWESLQPGTYFRTTHQLELNRNINIHMFKQCWNLVAERNPIMRTRVTELPERGYTQIIVDEIPTWVERKTLKECQQELALNHKTAGGRLVSFGLAPDYAKHSMWFLWDVHWAAYDGWSLRLLLAEAENLYHGRSPDPLNDMRVLTDWLHQQDSRNIELYWSDQFSGLTSGSLAFPTVSHDSTPAPDHDLFILLKDFGSQSTGFTATTLIRAGLALVLARYLSTDMVLFGATVTGRQGSAAGLDRMAGPAFATLPICFTIDSRDTDASVLLEKVQSQMMNMIAFEQTDLEHYRCLIPGAGIACDFKVLLVVQSPIPRNDARNRDSDLESIFTDGLKAGKDALVELGWRSGRRLPMLVECQLQETGDLMVRLRVDSRTMERSLFESFLQQLGQEISNLAKITTDAL